MSGAPGRSQAPRNLGNLALGFFFLAIFAVTVTEALEFAREGQRWVVGDWLINYAGGFVRRGLIGEVVRYAAMGSGLPIVHFVAGLQIASYGIILVGVYMVCAHLKKELWLVLFLVSPATFLFQVYAYDGGYRKEILFIAFLVLLALASLRGLAAPAPLALHVVLASCALALVLAHEALFLYFPYLVAVLWLALRHDARGQWIAGGLSLLVGAIAFALSIWFHGDKDTVAKICDSVRAMVPGNEVCGGAMRGIMWNASGGHAVVRWYVREYHYLKIYGVAVTLSMVPYALYLASRRDGWRDRRFLASVIGAPLLAGLTTIPLFLIASDWGRFIHTHVMCILIVVLCLEIRQPAAPSTSRPIGIAPLRVLLPSLTPVYMLAWRLPHCCGQGIGLDLLALLERLRINALVVWWR